MRTYISTIVGTCQTDEKKRNLTAKNWELKSVGDVTSYLVGGSIIHSDDWFQAQRNNTELYIKQYCVFFPYKNMICRKHAFFYD